MPPRTLEQEAKRLFTTHSPIIRACIERFSSFSRDDATSRVALGFMPHSPEKYTLLSQMYQSVHQALVCLYRVHKDGAAAATLSDWLGLLQFDTELLEKNKHGGALRVLLDQPLVQQFQILSDDITAFRLTYLKEMLTLARQEAERAALSGETTAHSMFESISDRMLDAVQQAEAMRNCQLDEAAVQAFQAERKARRFFGGLLRAV